MAILYVGIAYSGAVSLRQCIIVAKAFREQSLRDDPNLDIMGPSMELKQH